MEATLCASIPYATRPGMDGMKENLSYDELIAPANGDVGGQGDVRCRERLGGLLKFYYRDAA